MGDYKTKLGLKEDRSEMKEILKKGFFRSEREECEIENKRKNFYL